MDIHDLEKILRIIKNTEENLIDDSFAIEFNSGEILCKKKFLLEGIRLIKSYFADDKRHVTIPIQTNGTIYSHELSKVLKQYHIGLSVSYDGPEMIHNKNRVFPNGQGSHNIILNNIKKYSKDGINIGVLATATNPKDIKEIYENFLSISEFIIGFKINPVYICGRQKNIEGRDNFYHEMGKEYVKVFDDFIHNEMNNFSFLDPFSDFAFYLSSILFYENPFMCRTNPCGAGINQLTFGYDGKIYPCQEFIGNERYVITDINNITSLGEVSNYIQNMNFTNRRIPKDCEICPYFNFCGNSCVAHCLNANNDINSKIPDCEYYKVIFQYLFRRISENDEALFNFIKKYVTRSFSKN